MPINARLPLLGRRLFRLRNILLTVMLTVLALALGGLYFFRIYENELVQQTERELIAQSAALSASYRQLARNLNSAGSSYGRLLAIRPPDVYEPDKALDNYYRPIIPGLSLINPIEPPRPPAQPAPMPADALAQHAGLLLAPVMRDTQQVTLSGVRLLDMNGTVIAGREEVGYSLAHVPEVRQALQGRYASVIRQRMSDEPPPPLYSISRGTNVRVFVAFPIMEADRLLGVFYLSRTPNNILKHLYAVKERVLIATLSLLTLVVLLVILVSSTISRPIRELINQTERIRQGEQKSFEPLAYPVTYEIARLSESFVSMSKALSERSDYIRRFATHVSHEFKTPLTSLQGALELLQDHLDTMPPEQRQRFIGNLLADTQRLKQLVTRLLELAHADALVASRQQCYLADVIPQLKSRYSDRGLELAYTGLADAPLCFAADALETVLVNLLENSLQHGASKMEIVTVLGDKELQIRLQDNGVGITSANRNKIFTPFFTTRRNTGGTGLGLEIAGSLLKAYSGGIELGESWKGALFVVTLPLIKI
jgi:signal transduction histidine kinase